MLSESAQWQIAELRAKAGADRRKREALAREQGRAEKAASEAQIEALRSQWGAGS